MIKHYTTSISVFREFEMHWKTVLILHKKFNRWMVPGGHIELNENPNDGALREVKEETGLTVKLISFIHEKRAVTDATWLLPPEYFFEQYIPGNNREDAHFHLDLNYIAIATDEQLQFNAMETTDLKWFSLDELDGLELFQGTRMVYSDVKEKLQSNQKYLIKW